MAEQSTTVKAVFIRGKTPPSVIDVPRTEMWPQHVGGHLGQVDFHRVQSQSPDSPDSWVFFDSKPPKRMIIMNLIDGFPSPMPDEQINELIGLAQEVP